MAVFTGNGSAASPSFTFSGDTNTGLYSVVNGTMGIVTAGADRIVINDLGNVTVGTSTPVSIPTFTTHRFQVHGTSWGSTGAILGYWANSSSTTNLIFAKSRGTTIGSQGLSVSGDALGSIYSYGSDGAALQPATRILSSVDGTAAAGNMPGRIQFYTTPSGSTTPTEVARFTSDKYLRMASGTGGIQFGGDTAAANALEDYEEGSWTPTISSESGSWGSITYALRQGWYTKIGALVHISCTLATNDVASGTESGDLVITGVPFPLNFGSTTVQAALGSISWSRTSQATWPYGVRHTGGASQRLKFPTNSGTAQNSYAPTTDIVTGSNPFFNQISFSYTYLTNN